jgi:uncharacterized protein (TIGR02217 family)
MSDLIREVLFPEGIAEGSSGGPRLKTTIFASEQGYEQRNIDWSAVKSEYDVGQAVKTPLQIETLEAFFNAVAKGRAYGFRFKDWADYTVTDERLGTGDGATTAFQINKTYTYTQAESGETYTFVRPLYKIAWASVSGVTVAGVAKVEGTHFSVDYNKGLITFLSAPTGGQAVVLGHAEFHVPCRFDTDHFDPSHDSYGAQSWPNVPIVEIRQKTDPTVIEEVPLVPPPPPAPYVPGGVTFDGATSLINASLTCTDSPYLTVAFWFRSDPRATVSSFGLWWISDPVDTYNTYASWEPGAPIYSQVHFTSASPDDDEYADGAWHHCLVAYDGSTSTTQIVMAIDSVIVHSETNSGPYTPTLNGKPFFMGNDTFADWLEADMADFWFAPGVNLLVAGSIPLATRKKFYDPDTEQATDVGADGSLVTGTAPLIFLHIDPGDPAGDFLLNRGSGADFTYASGALIATVDNPPD